MTHLPDIERALAEFDASCLDGWERGTDYQTPEPSMLASPMMLFHPGTASKEKQEIFAYFWAVELDDRERALLSRLPMALAATIVLRVHLEGNSGGDYSLNDPAAAPLRRLARAKGCARVLMAGLSSKDLFEAPPWTASAATGPRERAFSAPKARRPLSERISSFFSLAGAACRRQSGLLMISVGFSILFLFMASLAIANPGWPTIAMLGAALPCAAWPAATLFSNFLANRAFIEKVFAALPLLAEAYPDLAARGLFEPPSGLRDGAFNNKRHIPELLLLARLQDAIEAEKINHPAIQDASSKRAGSILGHVLSEHPGRAWPNDRLLALREEIAIGGCALPGSLVGKASRL